MNVLLIGGKGSIGRRYQAIFNDLGVSYDVLDEPDTDSAVDRLYNLCGVSYTKALICTPTDSHYVMCNACLDMKLPFLVEKPLTFDVVTSLELAKRAKFENIPCYTVNNYFFLLRKYNPKFEISFNYYNTGRDGFEWDLCQLLFYADKHDINFEFENSSPIWTLAADRRLVPYHRVEISYMNMINAWLLDAEGLMDLFEGAAMTVSVKRLLDESLDRDTGKNQQQAAR